jgi:hypothetical protein
MGQIQNASGISYTRDPTPGTFAAIVGLDNRMGLTAADAAAKTLFTTTAAGQLFRLSARVLATAGSSATYTLTWTEGGAERTEALTVAGAGTEYAGTWLIQPDNATNITAQLTAISASTVNVAASVECLKGNL